MGIGKVIPDEIVHQDRNFAIPSAFRHHGAALAERGSSREHTHRARALVERWGAASAAWQYPSGAFVREELAFGNSGSGRSQLRGPHVDRGRAGNRAERYVSKPLRRPIQYAANGLDV